MRSPGPRGAGGDVSEPHIPITTATRPYPGITLFFYFYPPSPSRRPARTHARFCTSRPGEFKRRHVLKSTAGVDHSAPLRLNSTEILLRVRISHSAMYDCNLLYITSSNGHLISGTCPSKTQKKIGDERFRPRYSIYQSTKAHTAGNTKHTQQRIPGARYDHVKVPCDILSTSDRRARYK